jgi:hypothetical protein
MEVRPAIRSARWSPARRAASLRSSFRSAAAKFCCDGWSVWRTSFSCTRLAATVSNPWFDKRSRGGSRRNCWKTATNARASLPSNSIRFQTTSSDDIESAPARHETLLACPENREVNALASRLMRGNEIGLQQMVVGFVRQGPALCRVDLYVELSDGLDTFEREPIDLGVVDVAERFR